MHDAAVFFIILLHFHISFHFEISDWSFNLFPFICKLYGYFYTRLILALVLGVLLVLSRISNSLFQPRIQQLRRLSENKNVFILDALQRKVALNLNNVVLLDVKAIHEMFNSVIYKADNCGVPVTQN